MLLKIFASFVILSTTAISAQAAAQDAIFSPIVRIEGGAGASTCTATVISERVLLTAAHCVHFILGEEDRRLPKNDIRRMPVIRINGTDKQGKRISLRTYARAWERHSTFRLINRHKAEGRDIGLIEIAGGYINGGRQPLLPVANAEALFGRLEVSTGGVHRGVPVLVGGHRRSEGWDQSGFVTGKISRVVGDHLRITETRLWKSSAAANIAPGDSGAPVMVEGPAGTPLIVAIAVHIVQFKIFGRMVGDGVAMAEEINDDAISWIRSFLSKD